MSRNSSHWQILFVTAVFAFAILFFFMRRDADVYDEAIVLTGALRTLANEIPHRDYYSNYGPAQNYIVALLFSMFGKSLLVARVYSLLTMTAIVTLGLSIGLGRIRWFFSALTVLILLGFLISTQSHLYPVFPVSVLSLLGAAVLIGRTGTPGIVSAALAGACAGLAALFRYDSGFILLVSFSAHLIIMGWLRPADCPLKTTSLNVLACGLASGIVFAPFAASFLLVASPQQFIYEIIEVPLTIYGKFRALPFPGFNNAGQFAMVSGVYFPLIVLALAAIEGLTSRIWHREDPRDGLRVPILVLFGLLTVLMYYKGLVRVQTLHMLLSIIPATILLGVTLDRIWSRWSWKLAVPTTALAALSPAAMGAIELKLIAAQPDRAVGSWVLAGVPRAGPCGSLDARSLIGVSDAHLATSRYLALHMPAGERLFVGLGQHDRTFANPLLLYFLADRLPGTIWHQFDAGVQSRADIQQKIIADLERNRVKWVVRDTRYDNVREPNQSAVSSGVFLLDTYLADNFRPVAFSGSVSIWLHKTIPAPTPVAREFCSAQPFADAA